MQVPPESWTYISVIMDDYFKSVEKVLTSYEAKRFRTYETTAEIKDDMKSDIEMTLVREKISSKMFSIVGSNDSMEDTYAEYWTA